MLFCFQSHCHPSSRLHINKSLLPSQHLLPPLESWIPHCGNCLQCLWLRQCLLDWYLIILVDYNNNCPVIGWNLQVCMPTCLTSPPQRTEPPGKRILWDKVFSPPNKYCRIGMLDIFAFVGFTLGMLFSAIIFNYSGFFGVFGTTLGTIHFCLAFFPILVLNWSKFHLSIHHV